MNDEQWQESRQVKSFSHSILRLEQVKRSAETLADFHALYELTEAVAVDGVDILKIEENLLPAVGEKAIDDLAEKLVTDTCDEATVEVDDDDITVLADIHFHAGGMIHVFEGLVASR